MSSKTYKAVLVGCGVIGAGHDEYSHAAAYTQHPNMDLVACVDPNAQNVSACCEKWNLLAGYASLEDAIADGIEADVISIATPKAFHEEALRQGVELHPKAVICEKPFTGGLVQAQAILALYGDKGISLAVNYHRCWDPTLIKLRDDLASGVWGNVQSIHGGYCKGLYQNGSHIINLLEFLLGSLELVAVTDMKPGFEDDDTFGFVLKTSQGAMAYIGGLATNPYFFHELTIYCEKGAIAIEDAGQTVRLRLVDDDPLFPGERHLSRGAFQETENTASFYNAIDNVFNHLESGAHLNCTGEDGAKVIQLCEMIRFMSDGGGDA
ncbi:Gfo/Idh/MocA family oxidoreductase [Magnetovibrio sp. PR-2]|uniref:Gfo/Idh/MocA family protein n=1 Tax=Magnetovibrio sp. PR-2 TaxID=3120356 RepID=UPI002FCE3884